MIQVSPNRGFRFTDGKMKMKWRQRSESVEIKPLKWAFVPFCCKPLLRLKLNALTHLHTSPSLPPSCMYTCACVCVFPVRLEAQEGLTHFLLQLSLLHGADTPRLCLCRGCPASGMPSALPGNLGFRWWRGRSPASRAWRVIIAPERSSCFLFAEATRRTGAASGWSHHLQGTLLALALFSVILLRWGHAYLIRMHYSLGLLAQTRRKHPVSLATYHLVPNGRNSAPAGQLPWGCVGVSGGDVLLNFQSSQWLFLG